MKNTGKTSEQDFEAAFAKLGKAAYIHRFVDAAEIRGKTGKVAIGASAQPSDYVVVYEGIHFAEVKSTGNATSFPFSLLRTTQSAAARMILSAGGTYWVYAHSLVHKRWYRFPYTLIEEVKSKGKSSIKWADLAPYLWTLPNG